MYSLKGKVQTKKPRTATHKDNIYGPRNTRIHTHTWNMSEHIQQAKEEVKQVSAHTRIYMYTHSFEVIRVHIREFIKKKINKEKSVICL